MNRIVLALSAIITMGYEQLTSLLAKLECSMRVTAGEQTLDLGGENYPGKTACLSNRYRLGRAKSLRTVCSYVLRTVPGMDRGHCVGGSSVSTMRFASARAAAAAASRDANTPRGLPLWYPQHVALNSIMR